MTKRLVTARFPCVTPEKLRNIGEPSIRPVDSGSAPMLFDLRNWLRNMPVQPYSRLSHLFSKSRETPANQIGKSGNTKETSAAHH